MKLSSTLLKRIIQEEISKFGDMESTEDRAKDTDEVDPDGHDDVLAKKIDYAKALKIEEARLRKRLAQVSENRLRVLKSIQRNI